MSNWRESSGPLPTRWKATARLQNLTEKNERVVPDDGNKLRVLFLCTGNSCRSQMSEGWARHIKSDRIDPYSAGVKPHGMNNLAIQVMKEAGVDIGQQHSKHIDELNDLQFDYV